MMNEPSLPNIPTSVWTNNRALRDLLLLTSLKKLVAVGVFLLAAIVAPRPWRDVLVFGILAVASLSIGRPIYLYFFRFKPAVRNAQAAHEHAVRVSAEVAASREPAYAAFQAAYDQGRAFLAAMQDRAEGSGQRERVFKAQRDFYAAMVSSADEPDLATRWTLEAEAMRDSIRMTTMINGSLARP